MSSNKETPEETILSNKLLLLAKKTSDLKNRGNLEKISHLIQELEKVFDENVSLSKTEKEALETTLKKTLQPRFNNYKNGTKQKGTQVKPPATLKIHYRKQLNDRVTSMMNVFSEGKTITCCGISSKDQSTSKCPECNSLNPRDLKLSNFTLDHYIEQDSVNVTMENCIKSIDDPFLKKHGLTNDTILGFVKKNFKEPPKTELQKELYTLLEKKINLNLYREDLYGKNLYFRCTQCNTKSKSRKNHPEIKPDRYLL